jgi:hypothetical protein
MSSPTTQPQHHYNMSTSTNKHTPGHHWTEPQNRQLTELRDILRKPWAEIAAVLSRSISACQVHYKLLKQESEGSFIDWTPELDHSIIDGRRRGLSAKAIAYDLNISNHAVAGRWSRLQHLNLVPDDVLAVWRRKEPVVWSNAEDEYLLAMWIDGKSDDEITQAGKIKGKSPVDVKNRRVELVQGGGGGIYVRMLGVAKENEATTALSKALGKPKYSWMK